MALIWKKDKLEKWDPAEHEGKDVFDNGRSTQLRKGMNVRSICRRAVRS